MAGPRLHLRLACRALLLSGRGQTTGGNMVQMQNTGNNQVNELAPCRKRDWQGALFHLFDYSYC